jgi:2,4-dienoyl-CoA reductase-like NADH-dependent reductase (Old Yellow Enzyme family)
MALRQVLTPLTVGPVTLPNRVVRTGHGTGLGRGTINDTLIDYHVARARGGTGLTIVELLAVGTSSYPFLHQHGSDLAGGYRRLMERVRPTGMKVFQQIGHLGNEVPQADGSPPWSSSDTVGALLGVQAEAMDEREIAELKDAYRAAVLDAYGGSFESRLRLPLELLSLVRELLPPTMALGVRLSPELLPGGMTDEDVAAVAREFRARGLIDYVNLTLGTDYNAHKMIGAMHEPVGYEVPHAAPVRAALDLPVLVTGRFRTLEEADEVIRAGRADLVALTRAQIADPDLVAKTRAGRPESVRPCIGCNHGCIGGLNVAGRMGCTVNVAVGAEATLAEDLIRPSGRPKRVLVVGGGPAGLEAARIAALRGHRVVLAEAADELGGALNVAKRAPRRAGIGDIVEWLEREIHRLGVDVHLGTYVEAAEVRAIAPDAVIVATGSEPRLDGRQYRSPGRVAAGMDRSHVISSHDLLLAGRDREFGTSALVYDDAGHYEAVAAAEALIERGLAVTFATGLSRFAPALEASLSAEPALERLARGRFRLITYARLDEVRERTAVISRRFGGPAEEIAAETVVFVSHNRCRRDLVDELRGFAGTVTLVGDARSPRYLQVAIREGHLAARGLD